MKKVITVIGTRPEAIKLAPLILSLKNNKHLQNKICTSSQHTDLVTLVLAQNNIQPDYKLPNYPKAYSLHQSITHMLNEFSLVFKQTMPDLVIVQGDTTTAFAGALAAFYLQIPIAHIEAGLRTNDFTSPWPEEMHRCLIDRLTTYFFAPTQSAKESLIKEGVISEKIWVVGNTSIDAIRLIQKSLKTRKNNKNNTILATVHRKENYGTRLIEICQGLRTIAQKFQQIKIIFCTHPNPLAHIPVTKMLSDISNIELVPPTDHYSFLELMHESIFIVTDSGGIQEEASFIGKPVILLRNTTERPEGVDAGTTKIVGSKALDIINSCTELLTNQNTLKKMSKVHLSYGDGFAAQRIVEILEKELSYSKPFVASTV